jgi:hypothetical protein
MPSFTQVSVYLWENGIRYGVVNAADLASIEQAAATLGDTSVRDRPAGFGMTGWTRDLAYTTRFPPLYSSSMIRGQVFFRYAENRSLFADITASRGYVPHETVQKGGGGGIGPEARMSDFAALPIQDYYFDRTLALLSELGLPVYYVSLPLSEQTLERTRPEITEKFASYLHRRAEKYDNLHIVNDRAPGWPEDLFVDDNHLNRRGAELLSDTLGRCFSELVKGSNEVVGMCDLGLKADH